MQKKKREKNCSSNCLTHLDWRGGGGLAVVLASCRGEWTTRFYANLDEGEFSGLEVRLGLVPKMRLLMPRVCLRVERNGGELTACARQLATELACVSR